MFAKDAMVHVMIIIYFPAIISLDYQLVVYLIIVITLMEHVIKAIFWHILKNTLRHMILLWNKVIFYNFLSVNLVHSIVKTALGFYYFLFILLNLNEKLKISPLFFIIFLVILWRIMDFFLYLVQLKFYFINCKWFLWKFYLSPKF